MTAEKEPSMTSIDKAAGEGGRIFLWDNLKFFLILMVVIGHFADQYSSDSLQSVFLFIYGFHMPLFIFLAGLFHKNTRIPQKVTVYFALYILYRAVLLVIAAAFRRSPSIQLFSTAATPWFLFSMAVFIGLTWLLRDVNPWFLLGLSVATACLAGYDSSIGDAFFLSRTLVFYPFYLLGTIASRERLEAMNRRPALRIAGILVIAAWLAVCFLFRDPLYALRPLLTGRNAYSTSLGSLGCFFRLGCYGLSLVLGFALILAAPARPVGVFTLFGQRTLQVYFWHRPLLYILTFLDVNNRICTLPRGTILWLLAAVALTVILSLKPFGLLTDGILRFQRWEPPKE